MRSEGRGHRRMLRTEMLAGQVVGLTRQSNSRLILALAIELYDLLMQPGDVLERALHSRLLCPRQPPLNSQKPNEHQHDSDAVSHRTPSRSAPLHH